VPALIDSLPWLIAMAVLIACSAFFSASEAALFYLRARDHAKLALGNRAQRFAGALLKDPERLLSAVLFWNLVVNMAYFAIVSIVGLAVERHASGGQSAAFVVALGALLTIIFFSEMLPKSLAVLGPLRIASVVGVPLAIAVRLVDPLMPVLRLTNLLSRRLFWPGFKSEPYLEMVDLERAITLSTTDAELIEQEQAMLRNIVSLSDIRVDEWMRPRTQFLTFRPPVSLADLEGRLTPSGYLLVSEPDSDEVSGAIHLQSLSEIPPEHLEYYADPIVYVPWCTTVAEALEQMQNRDREVAAVVNELGETIGILTFEDILDSIFTYNPSRSSRLLNQPPIRDIQPGVWHVQGITGLRRLSRYLDLELPASKSVTVTGVVQEELQRLAEVDDQCDWGPLHFRVLEVLQRGHLLVEMTRNNKEVE